MRGTKEVVMRGAVFVGALLGIVTSALAGTSNAFTFYPIGSDPVSAYSNNVTYSTPAGTKPTTPAMTTYVGFTVGDPVTGILIKNDSGNTLNNITIVFSADVTDTSEALTLQQPDVYLPTSCTWDNLPGNPKKVTCVVRQLKNGEYFPSFSVWFVAPQKVCQLGPLAQPCGSANDLPGGDKINTSISLLYAEGPNGAPTSPQNSSQFVSMPGLVTLGTDNPTNIKSGVPKSGAKVFTGDGAIPKNETGKKFTEALVVPDLTATVPAVPYTLTRIDVSSVSSTAPEGSVCLNYGRFTECPTFKTTIAQEIDPLTGDAISPETRFDPTKFVEFTYRIDASNLKMSPPKLLNSVQILYTGPKYTYDSINGYSKVPDSSWVDEPVTICSVPNTPRTDGMPCLKAPGFCYKKNQTGGIADLEGDCEWTTISTGNGYLKLQ